MRFLSAVYIIYAAEWIVYPINNIFYALTKTGASLEAALYVYAPTQELRNILMRLKGDEQLICPPQRTNNVDDLRFLLLTSQVHLLDTDDELKTFPEAQSALANTESGALIGLKKATGTKCSRCWFYCDSVNTHPDLPHICSRCTHAVEADYKDFKVDREVLRKVEEKERAAAPS